MKKITTGLLVLLLLTGCSNKNNNQTLFVENNKEKYALVDFDGEKQTKFIYDKYEEVGTSGYIVIKGDQYGYLLRDGKEVIKLGKYSKLETISNMIVGYDKDKNISIISDEGEVLYTSDKDTKITLSGLPIVYSSKVYLVLYDTGKVLIEDKSKVVSAYMIDTNCVIVNYEDQATIHDFGFDKVLDKIKVGGNNQLMDSHEKKGYLLYNRESKDVNVINSEGKVSFTANIDLDDLYFDDSNNIVGVKNQTTYLFDSKGNPLACNSYYKNNKNYVQKNKNLIYGPHKFICDGEEIEVNNIQLDPMASYTSSDIFPVYVRDEGYQYYTFKGKPAFKTNFESASSFDENGLAVVSKKEDKCYLIDKTGKKVGKEYVRVEYIDNQYYAGYTTGSKYVVIDVEGKQVIDDSFMDQGTIFEYMGNVYGIFNKSGTACVYDMEDYEVIFTVEGELEFNDRGYFILGEGKAYYTLEGKEIYKR